MKNCNLMLATIALTGTMLTSVTSANVISFLDTTVIGNTIYADQSDQTYQLSSSDRNGYAFLTGNSHETVNTFEIWASNGDSFNPTTNMLYMDVFSGNSVDTSGDRWKPLNGASADATYSFNNAFTSGGQAQQILFDIDDLVLQANTHYALSLYSESGSSFQVLSIMTEPNSGIRPGYMSETGAIMGEVYDPTDNGGNGDFRRSNFSTSDSGTNWESQTSERIFALGYIADVTEISEPSTLSMISLIILVGGVARRKARRA